MERIIRIHPRYKITQWLVVVDGRDMALFTTLNCPGETAMAIAVATFGAGVTDLVHEGDDAIHLTDAQLHIADPANCAECGCYKTHEDTCPKGGAA